MRVFSRRDRQRAMGAGNGQEVETHWEESPAKGFEGPPRYLEEWRRSLSQAGDVPKSKDP